MDYLNKKTPEDISARPTEAVDMAKGAAQSRFTTAAPATPAAGHAAAPAAHQAASTAASMNPGAIAAKKAVSAAAEAMAQNESAGAGSINSQNMGISSQDLGISDSDQDISLDSIGKKGKFGKAGKQAKQAKKGKSRKADDEEKPLNKLKKNELLQIMLAQGEEIDALRARVAELEAQLANREFNLQKVGSIAQASLQVTEIFREAEKAAAIYLENIRRRYE